MKKYYGCNIFTQFLCLEEGNDLEIMKIVDMTLSDFELIKENLISDFDDFWNENILRQELLNENRKYVVAKENNDVLGFAGVSICENEAELMNIVVKKNNRGSGIGKALLEKIIEILKSEKIEVLKLEVNSKNNVAFKLYSSLDFEVVRSKKKLL